MVNTAIEKKFVVSYEWIAQFKGRNAAGMTGSHFRCVLHAMENIAIEIRLRHRE